MLHNKEKSKSIQAAHGKWIRDLQESIKVIKQDLSLLEKRVSAFESEIAERARTHRKIKSEINSLRAKIERSCSK
ncbi:hypothetical protein AKJ57_03230 [candidate division MSBL1 archaeon SCGC-AAA259A05]|uniref:Uncharacterized protein n=1 Tax=candidate division MSBL1 archaeon SCGC-AAA259A05 TaxID=1698259 RepID=A0A133U9M0_9EURY|nr:hypothetical protein AKJ57_03230 [candidate division MSBL1 archaeon SCGC-AAA259A05]